MTPRRAPPVMPMTTDGEDAVMVDINTTPLIDVMLVLLIMLIITVPVQTHAVKLDMPVAEPPVTEPPPVVRLVIDADGTILWDGTLVPDRAALAQNLDAVAAQTPQPELHVRPDKRVRYGAVAMVLAEAQRAGVTRLGIAGGEAY